MTNQNLTAISVIIDESGSMHNLQADTQGGFNRFLADQKAVPGDAVFTLCTFNDDYRLVHDFVKIASVPDLSATSYKPQGSTALLDAMGETITELGKKLAAMKEEDRPSKVLVLVITDGQENASHRFKKAQIREMVKHQQDVYNWEFMFFGASLEQVAEGVSLGIDKQKSVSYTPTAAGTRSLYKSISNSTTTYRNSK